jgi:hypothetical protein
MADHTEKQTFNPIICMSKNGVMYGTEHHLENHIFLMWNMFAFNASTFSTSTQSVQALGQYVDCRGTGIQFLAETTQAFLLSNMKIDSEAQLAFNHCVT